MLRLFDPHAGIGISFLRNPIGSSDLTRGWYTYDDNSSDRADASLPHFSIDHDLADVLPLTKLARQLNPQLTLMINAWSPPAWMTSSGSLVAARVLRGPCELSRENHPSLRGAWPARELCVAEQ